MIVLDLGMPSIGVSGVAETKKSEAGGDASPQKSRSNMLVISGGEGYIDFRQGNVSPPPSYHCTMHESRSSDYAAMITVVYSEQVKQRTISDYRK